MPQVARKADNSGAKVPLKTTKTGFKATPDQVQAIEQRAEQCGVKAGTWMRSILLQAAKRTGPPGYVRVREPDGTTI